jgi:hypothetical protein
MKRGRIEEKRRSGKALPWRGAGRLMGRLKLGGTSMKTRIGAVLATALMLTSATSAWAQTAPADMAQRRVLTRQYMELVNLTKILDTMTQSMSASMAPGPNVPPEVVKAMRESVTESMGAVVPRILEEMVDVYANKLTVEELTALIDFYGSPTGRSITVKTEQLAGETGPLMRKYTPIMQREMLTRLCGKIACPDEVKTSIKALDAQIGS